MEPLIDNLELVIELYRIRNDAAIHRLTQNIKELESQIKIMNEHIAVLAMLLPKD